MTEDIDEEPEAPQERSEWAVRALIGVLVAIILICLFGSAFQDDEDGAEQGNRYDAERVCEKEFIAKRLKAPATADYNLTAQGGPTTFTVTGTVDAENSFGAKLRMNVTCVVSIATESRWRLDSLTGIE